MSNDAVIVGMEPMTYHQAENLLKAAHEAQHGAGSWQDLDLVARDTMIEALRDRADIMGVGVAVCG